MEKIKITGSDDIYQIQSIRKSAEHILQIIFCDNVPASWMETSRYTLRAVS